MFFSLKFYKNYISFCFVEAIAKDVVVTRCRFMQLVLSCSSIFCAISSAARLVLLSKLDSDLFNVAVFCPEL